MPASSSAATRRSLEPAPSTFTVSTPASFTKRIACATVSLSDTWNEPNGMSATTSARVVPRRTARDSSSISSTVIGVVES